MIAGGLRARLSCVDTKQLPATFAGREFDLSLLRDLPPEADPCGERGEFHTCVYAGPMFSCAAAHRNRRGRHARRIHLRGLRNAGCRSRERLVSQGCAAPDTAFSTRA